MKSWSRAFPWTSFSAAVSRKWLNVTTSLQGKNVRTQNGGLRQEFIHSVNIYREPTLCQALPYVVWPQPWWKTWNSMLVTALRGLVENSHYKINICVSRWRVLRRKWKLGARDKEWPRKEGNKWYCRQQRHPPFGWGSIWMDTRTQAQPWRQLGRVSQVLAGKMQNGLRYRAERGSGGQLRPGPGRVSQVSMRTPGFIMRWETTGGFWEKFCPVF